MDIFKKFKELRKNEDNLKKPRNMDQKPKNYEPELELTPKMTQESKSDTNPNNSNKDIPHLDSERINERKKTIEKTKEHMSSNFESKVPTPEEILTSGGNPYIVFGVGLKTTCDEIKSQHQKLSRTYYVSRGINKKTKEEIDKMTQVQMMVNRAHEELKEKHRCG